MPVDSGLSGSLGEDQEIVDGDRDLAKPIANSIKLESSLATTKKRSKLRRHLVNRINRCI